jgi:hypothetical protein
LDPGFDNETLALAAGFVAGFAAEPLALAAGFVAGFAAEPLALAAGLDTGLDADTDVLTTLVGGDAAFLAGTPFFVGAAERDKTCFAFGFATFATAPALDDLTIFAAIFIILQDSIKRAALSTTSQLECQPQIPSGQTAKHSGSTVVMVINEADLSDGGA